MTSTRTAGASNSSRRCRTTWGRDQREPTTTNAISPLRRVDTFHAIGIADVRLEPVVLPHGWQRGTARAQLLGRVPRALHVAAFGWSPPTPKNGVRAPLVHLADTTDGAVAAAKVRGAIVLIDRVSLVGPAVFHHGTVEEWQRERRAETLYARLRDAWRARRTCAGSRQDGQPRSLSNRWSPVDGAMVLPLPMAYVGNEDALLLRRQLAKGAVEIDLALETSITGPITVHNVVAELHGREKSGRRRHVGRAPGFLQGVSPGPAHRTTAAASRRSSKPPAQSRRLAPRRGAPCGSRCGPRKSRG